MMFFLAIFGIIGCALNVVGFIIFIQKKLCLQVIPTPLDTYPGVSIVKTCCGIKDNEETLFVHFFKQSYPGPLQLIFTVPDISDPAVSLIQTFQARYPTVDAQLVVSQTRRAAYKKVDAIYDAQSWIKHPITILSDSDTWVDACYTHKMVTALQEVDADLITTPQIDFGLNTLFSGLKYGNNADCATLLNLAYLNPRLDSLCFGHSMGFYTDVFNRSVDWNYLNHTLCDDQAIAKLFIKQGYKIVWKQIKSPVSFSNKTGFAFLDQQRRHAQCQKAPVGRMFLLGILGYPFWPLFAYSVAYPSFLSVGLWVGHWFFKTLSGGFQEKNVLGTIQDTFKWAWTIPLWEALKPLLIVYTIFSKTVIYHGVVYTIHNGFFLKKKPL